MTRRAWRMIAAFLFSGTVVAGFLAMVSDGKTGMRNGKPEGTAMMEGKTAETPPTSKEIPPMDRRPPAEIETAAFALG